MAAVTIATCLQPVTGGAAAAAAPVPFGTYTGSKPLAEIPNGTVLKTRTLPYHLRSFEVPLKVVQLLYRTTDALGRPTVNVTSVIKTPFQAKTSRAVAYGSFYDSLNPSDSPSDGISGGSSPGTVIINVETALVVPLLLEGYSVVVADTQGATADFAAGPEYGRTTLDSIRAVLQAPRTGVRSNARFALAGYSGGAIATEWAAALAPSYAPEVNKRLVGAAEGGVLVDPDHNLHYIEGSKVWAGVLLMALVGASRAADISLEPYLNPYGLSVFKKVENASIANVLGRYPGLTWKKIAKPQYATPEDVPAFVRVVNTLNIGSAPTPTIPMLIGQGANGVLEGTEKSTTYGAGDGVMVAGDVRGLARQYCAHGVRIRYRQYDATSHFTSVPLWVPEAVTWVTQRFGKAPAPSSCATIKPGNALTPLPVPAG
ncbi:MAG: triacylglycerol lipase [Marmoricola sp.]|nr:triacylglycerol lipase [Marmoricola sp.]